jgi:putative endonuclease
MYYRREIGRWGENLACKYLEEKGYKVIERNFFCRQGEIDIIAKDTKQKELVFIEVKTRSNFKYGNPADSVNKNKQKHMVQAIKYYLYKNHIKNIPVRIDVIEVYIVKKCKINHIKQII